MTAPSRLPGPLRAGWREFGSSSRQLMHFLRLRQGLRSQRRKCRQLNVLRNLLGGSARASQQRPAATAAASPGASGSTQAAPPAKPSFADVVAGRTTPEQAVLVLISEVQKLTMEISQVRAFGPRTYDQLQQEKQSSAEPLEHLHRHSKRSNLVVCGVPESRALNTPAALACHMQGLLFQTPTGSELTKVRSAFRLSKWKQDQGKPCAVLVELLSVAAKHTAFQAFKHLRAMKVRLSEDLTPQQMKTRRGLSTDFQWLKARGYKPFFRGITLRYRDGALIRKCLAAKPTRLWQLQLRQLGQQRLHPPGSNRLKSRMFQWPWTLQSFCTSMAFFLMGFLILAVWWLRQPRLSLLILIVWCTPLMMSPVRLLGSRFDVVNS